MQNAKQVSLGWQTKIDILNNISIPSKSLGHNLLDYYSSAYCGVVSQLFYYSSFGCKTECKQQY